MKAIPCFIKSNKMKNLIIVLSVFLAVSTVASAQTATKKEDKCEIKMVKTNKQKHNSAVKGSQASSEIVTKYVCSMDGAVSDKAGNCPKCGMAMTKQETQKTMYACPMHPNEMSANEGECSKCGMKLVKTVVEYNSAVKGSQSSSKVVTKYVCSMDGTTSDKPGKCSKCGMEMTEMKDK